MNMTFRLFGLLLFEVMTNGKGKCLIRVIGMPMWIMLKKEEL